MRLSPPCPASVSSLWQPRSLAGVSGSSDCHRVWFCWCFMEWSKWRGFFTESCRHWVLLLFLRFFTRGEETLFWYNHTFSINSHERGKGTSHPHLQPLHDMVPLWEERPYGGRSFLPLQLPLPLLSTLRAGLPFPRPGARVPAFAHLPYLRPPTAELLSLYQL